MKQLRSPLSTMGKHAHPPRAQARTSGVEKSRHTHRNSRILPSWYYRVMLTCIKENREVYAYDFDEDLSEMGDDKGQEGDGAEQSKNEEEDCICGSEDSECVCQIKDVDMDKDDVSQRSYDGSDAGCYYDMKYEREERKREKLQERKEKEEQQEMERIKEEEVDATERTLSRAEKERKTISIESLAGQGFLLFSSAHVDHFYTDFYATKRVDFYHQDDEDNQSLDKLKLGKDAGLLYGDVYLDSSASCNFGPFRPPKYATRKAIKVDSCDGRYELSFKFLGNGHLKLRVSQDMVFIRPYSESPPATPSAAPKVFEFVGIWRDREKEKAEREERIAKRSPSPRETWFEMNHPMGSWRQSRNF